MSHFYINAFSIHFPSSFFSLKILTLPLPALYYCVSYPYVLQVTYFDLWRLNGSVPFNLNTCLCSEHPFASCFIYLSCVRDLSLLVCTGIPLSTYVTGAISTRTYRSELRNALPQTLFYCYHLPSCWSKFCLGEGFRFMLVFSCNHNGSKMGPSVQWDFSGLLTKP